MSKQSTLSAFLGLSGPKQVTSPTKPAPKSPPSTKAKAASSTSPTKSSKEDGEKKNPAQTASEPVKAPEQHMDIDPPAKASKPSKAPSKAKDAISKKRKRVIDEDDEFVPGEEGAADDDYVIHDADMDIDEEANSDSDEVVLEEEEEEEVKKPAKKKIAQKSSVSAKVDDLLHKYSAGNPIEAEKSKNDFKRIAMDGTLDEKLKRAQDEADPVRHAYFAEQLVARVERMRDRMYQHPSEDAGGSDDEEEEEDEPQPKAKSGAKKGSKYTPLEQQYLDIRKDFPDSVLFVESGYKYKFFGKDAEIACKVLNIRGGVSHNFFTTSVPVHRLHVHALRLVQAGYKVGVVSQSETAALKAISNNKSGLFKRAVSALYTKSTLVNEAMDPLDSESNSYGQYLMAIYESKAPNTATKEVEKIRMDIVAVKTSTGDIIYDTFIDGFMRTELETRLRHINPIEIVLPENVSPQTRKIVDGLLSSRPKEDSIRVEYLNSNCFNIAHAKELIDDELALFDPSQSMKPTPAKKGGGAGAAKPDNTMAVDDHVLGAELRAKAVQFYKQTIDEALTICFGALTHYLKDFGISSLICLNCNFNSFSQAQRMQLDGHTLANLELIVNQQTQTKDGSLFAVLDRTTTPFGRRRLLTWIRQPLTNVDEIEARLEAVEELSRLSSSQLVSTESDQASITPSKAPGKYPANTSRQSLSRLLELLPQLNDLERGICRIFYNRCSVSEFINVLSAFRHIERRMPKPDEIDACCKSTLLKKLLKNLPHDLADHVSYFLDPLNLESTDKQKRDLFMQDNMFPDLKHAKEMQKEVEGELNEHLLELRKILGKPRLEYITKNKDEYVIEVTKAEGARAPSDWTALPCPKTLARFHTPFVLEKYQELLQWRETLAIETANAWSTFVKEFASRYSIFRATVDALATLDCLASFSVLAKTEGFVRPRVVDPALLAKQDDFKRPKDIDDYCEISIEEGRHPIVEGLLASSGGGAFVPNDTAMGAVSHHQKCTIITGPNMGGKTCYTRQVAVLCIVAQMGCFVPAKAMTLTPLNAIYTRMGAYDNLAKGQSTFFVELQETSDILSQATSRSLAILDELGRGTSTHDGYAIAFATMQRLLTNNKCFTLFVTHYPALSQLTSLYPDLVQNHHMGYLEEEAATSGPLDSMDMDMDSQPAPTQKAVPRITFLHKLVRGVEGRSFGMNVARLAHLGDQVIERAAAKSTLLETRIKRQYARVGLSKLYQLALAHPSDQDLVKQVQSLRSTLQATTISGRHLDHV